MELSFPSNLKQCFLLISISLFTRGDNLFSFLCTSIWSEVTYIAMCLSNKDQDFIFLLNQLNFYLFSTTMSSITGNYTMDLFYLLKRTLKISYLTHEPRRGALRICLIYQVIHCHKEGDFQDYTWTNCEALNQILFIEKYWRPSPNTFKCLVVYGTHKAETCLRIRSKLMSAFSLWLYNLV